MNALKGSGIDVMVGIPNGMLSLLSSSPKAARSWVRHNLTSYVSAKTPTNIRYVAVGNEPFLSSYSGQFQSYVVAALVNLQEALVKAKLSDSIKLVVPCNADAYGSTVPSNGSFRPELRDIMTQLVSFLVSSGSPFVVNIYPFVSFYEKSDFPLDYALFDGTKHPLVDGLNTYTNAFDGNYDTLVASLTKIGHSDIPIVVGEVGWPTEGANGANVENAKAFNQGLIRHIQTRTGTPLRANVPPVDVFIFGLLDEGKKPILTGNFERHWGLFSYDGQTKYEIDLGSGPLQSAKDIQYLPPSWCIASPTGEISKSMKDQYNLACYYTDCTTLEAGGVCSGLGERDKMSYAFNNFYQFGRKQKPYSCLFNEVGRVTFIDPSVGNCRFPIALLDSGASNSLSRFTIFILIFVLGNVIINYVL
ncbi:hypothetical protein SOVF_180440 [Spinacia oleracea]|nr:hypothetical protein SOVF_180440 [Spinacia oleracea]